jgi:hypothetical protein
MFSLEDSVLPGYETASGMSGCQCVILKDQLDQFPGLTSSWRWRKYVTLKNTFQKPCNTVSHPRRMNSLVTPLQKPRNSTFCYFLKNNSHCWPHQIMHCHQWSLTTSNNAIPSKKFYHICVSRISLMMCPACWRAYKHKIIYYNRLCIAIMSIFSPQKSTKWLYTMSRFKTDVISLLVNNDQSDTFDAHSTGQI